MVGSLIRRVLGRSIATCETARLSIAKSSVQTFSHEEEGSTTILTLFIFVTMLIMAGVGIDTMRHEMERTHLQATMDSAVLAAAGAPLGTEKSKIKAIVEDYFQKNNMSEYLHAIDADGEGSDDIRTSLNATRVYAEGSISMDTYLMGLSGVDSLTAFAASAAEVRQPKLEVVLVLDTSGSMRGSKLRNLKVAAKDFVSTIRNGSEHGNTTVSIVPFSWSVTPPQSVFDALAVDVTHNYSTCLKFRENDFKHATLTSGKSAHSNGIPVDQMIYTSIYGSFGELNRSWRSCYTDAYMEFLPYSISESALHEKIDALRADGNTSGHQGMNWAAALLDPSFRAVSADLIAAGDVDASLSNIPADYSEPDTLKVIVMMGDGANTTSYFFDQSPPEYRGKHSDLFEVTYAEREFKYAYRTKGKKKKSYDERKCGKKNWECVYDGSGETQSEYFLKDPNDRRYFDIADGEWIEQSEFDNFSEDMPGHVSTEQMTWEQAWGLMTPEFYGEVTGDWSPWNDYVGSEQLYGSAKNIRMRNVCSATKSKGVVVYSIGFEVSRGGTAERELERCASSANHYYPASGTDISRAFNSIASNVQNLRLTE